VTVVTPPAVLLAIRQVTHLQQRQRQMQARAAVILVVVTHQEKEVSRKAA